MWYEKAIHEFWISCPPGIPADLKQERKPVRRPGGFEIRHKKMFDLLNRGICNPPHLASCLLAADFKSADPKKVRTFFDGGFQIRRDA